MFRKKFMAGDIRENMGDDPPMGRMSNNKIKVPYLLKMYSASAAISLGSMPTSIFPPSSG